MDATLAVEVLVTMFVIMDPVGNVPIFLVGHAAPRLSARNRAALLAVLTATLVIVVFALVGRQVLAYLGVSVPALQGAGGLLLLLVALELELLTGSGSGPWRPRASPRRAIHVAVAMVPLGTPLLAGPGAIVATIVFVTGADGPG
jgi:multiple antibiotic resistance protein